MTLDEIIKRNFTFISPEYEKFVREKYECNQCSIYDCYKQVGMSEGNASNPTFMIVGEGPGEEESLAVRPFVGRAGQRLRQELRKYPGTFNKNNTLISNVLSCRPRDNVFPRDQEYDIRSKKKNKVKVSGREIVNFCATKWVRREISILRPKMLVLLGAKALEYIRGDLGITNNRGTWKFADREQAWVTSTYHPSYVLRCQNDEDKDFVPRQFEEDIQKISVTWRSLLRNDPRKFLMEGVGTEEQ